MGVFQKHTGADILQTRVGKVGVVLVSLILLFLVSKSVMIIPGLLGFVALIYIIRVVYNRPDLALSFMFFYAHFTVGLTRLIPAPFGLLLDGIMFLLWLVLFFKGFYKGNWSLKNNSLTYLVGLWMLYCFFQLFNPESPSVLAWFYAVRGLAMNALFLVPLLFLIYNKQKHFDTFINIWFGVSIFMGLYGAKQFWFGPTGFEQRWLDAGGHVTHVLWGKFTRMFSFTSDANQFGCSQAHVASIAVIVFSTTKKLWKKIFYGSTAVICIYGMFISGTRGAIVILIISIGIYLLLSKNIKVIALGSIAGGMLLYILVFTYMFHSVAPIRRMRTAFQATEDASFQVRVENRAMLDRYLSDKPFGGGIGSAGVWGKRFSPGTFLANFETDGHYVRIKAETGPVGLYLYLLIHGIIIGKMLLISWRLKNPKLRAFMGALTCGVIGCMVSNFSAAVTVALPSSVLIYASMAFVYMAEKWDRGEELSDFI